MEVKYYECHITVEPVSGDRLEKFKEIAQIHNFRVADLVMIKDRLSTPERSNRDSFCTARGASVVELSINMGEMCFDLKEAGFKVWRGKIEAILYDQRFTS